MFTVAPLGQRDLPNAHSKGTAAPGRTQLSKSLPRLSGPPQSLLLFLWPHKTLESQGC